MQDENKNQQKKSRNPKWDADRKTWQKGQSGNPAGKPKGVLSSKTIIKKWLEAKERIKNPLTGSEEELTQYDIMALAMLKKARGGSVNHFNALLDRAEGKPVQSVIQEVSQKLVARIGGMENQQDQNQLEDDEE